MKPINVLCKEINLKAARLHGPRDIRIDNVDEPPPPGPGEALIKITSVGLCGSDLHVYTDGQIGGVGLEAPLTLGHEFAGEVLAVGEGASDGEHNPLAPGTRVAIDPATPDVTHEMYERGHPNLCPEKFYGLYPDDGALQERMICNARNCFVLPPGVSDAAGALLEPLGVAIHALDLSKLKIGNTVVVIGCGPIGLLIIRLAKLTGASEILAFDLHQWRIEKALQWGATCVWRVTDDSDPVEQVMEATRARGVDIVFEAAWSDHTVNWAAEMSRHGGRLVLVGIPGDDRFSMKHSTARRKGLTIMISRRMKHTYPRAIKLALAGKSVIDLDDLVSHTMQLAETPRAFEIFEAYDDMVNKIIVDVPS